MSERMFPIQRGPAIPWQLIAPWESQCQHNHSQSVERLAERGGLSPKEALYVLHGVAWYLNRNPADQAIADRLEKSTTQQDIEELLELVRIRLAGIAASDAERELQSIDALIARRPALDKPTRYDNIAHAIATAGQKTDEVVRLESSLRQVREQKDQRIVELVQQCERMRQEIVTDEQLIAHRTLLLEAIPECPEHGQCVPHALEWIKNAKRWKDEITDMAVVDWSLSNENKDNPKQMVADMIQNAVNQALDPAISEAAQKLIDRGVKARERVCECEIYQTCEICRG